MGKFFARGVSICRWLPAWSGANPTGGEITAGTDLTAAYAGIEGFEYSNTPIPTPTADTTFDTTIPGVDAAANSSLTFYDDQAGSAIRSLLAKGTSGFVLWAPYGLGTGKRGEKWAVRSTGPNDSKNLLEAQAARFSVGFAITAAPNLNVTLP